MKVFVITEDGAYGEFVTVVIEPTYQDALKHLDESSLNETKTGPRNSDTKIIEIDTTKQGIAFSGGGSMG